MHHTDRKHLPFGHSSAIQDTETMLVLDCANLRLPTVLDDNSITEKFCQRYKQWIEKTTLNTITGLDQFKYYCYSNGTTESFDKFYIKNHNRRFRCFRGEYMYHQLAWRNAWPNWVFLDDSKLEKGDAVVVSLPFADTGNEHTSYKKLLEECDSLGVPVLVDCAYMGICSNIHFDLNFNCIRDVVFSLSKTFPIAHARVGIRFSKDDDDDTLFVYNKNQYTNRIGATLGLEFINKFSPDYIVNKYKSCQINFCNKLNLETSNTVLFGIDYNNKYTEYNRGRETNRLSFHKFFHLGNVDFK